MTDECGHHRPPEGPNEDVDICPRCRRMTHTMRPRNETYGEHLSDCSLGRYHEGHCMPGGTGHPRAEVIRGFWL